MFLEKRKKWHSPKIKSLKQTNNQKKNPKRIPQTHKAPPVSFSPRPTPGPFPINSKFELKQQKPLQLLSLAEGGDHGTHSGTCALML